MGRVGRGSGNRVVGNGSTGREGRGSGRGRPGAVDPGEGVGVAPVWTGFVAVPDGTAAGVDGTAGPGVTGEAGFPGSRPRTAAISANSRCAMAPSRTSVTRSAARSSRRVASV